jgi:hypothetical protein
MCPPAAGAYVAVYAVLRALYKRFASRFALEFFKVPQAAYEAGFSISVGQYLSVPFVCLGLLLVIIAIRTSNSSFQRSASGGRRTRGTVNGERAFMSLRDEDGEPNPIVLLQCLMTLANRLKMDVTG